MAERNLDFDALVERRGSNCLKYDFAVPRGHSEDEIPLWVADMDFRTTSYVQDAVGALAEHGIYGYSETDSAWFDAVASWYESRHGWRPEEKWLVKTPGVVFALAMAVKAYSAIGDSVLIQTPVYYPFTQVIEDNGRHVVTSPLVQDSEGRFVMDTDDMERKIEEYGIKLFLLCSPHNPVGRVWTKDELLRVLDICALHDVIVVSDEIHSDFVFHGTHSVFASLSDYARQHCVVCTSPSKTFNLAGTLLSNIFIPNEELRRAFQKQVDVAGMSQLSIFAIASCRAAYKYGGEWYDALMDYLRGNFAFVKSFLERSIPRIKVREPEGTYLMWLDMRDLGLSPREAESLVRNKARLWVDGGRMFGTGGEGFIRINAACPRITLEKAMDRLAAAVGSLDLPVVY